MKDTEEDTPEALLKAKINEVSRALHVLANEVDVRFSKKSIARFDATVDAYSLFLNEVKRSTRMEIGEV